MELKFLGRGAAFNPIQGSTSAYFIDYNQLFLIDCGESVFRKLIELNILDNLDGINVIITHTHSDHIGSLGSLVEYSYHVLKKKVNIVVKKDAKYIPSIVNILNVCGASDRYEFIYEDELDNKFDLFDKIRYVETTHSKKLDCYSIIIHTSNGVVYYSGDTNEVNTLKQLISGNEKIDKLYIEVTNVDYPGNVHIYIEILKEVIPIELREKVYCMHFNNDQCMDDVKEIGFNVVEI